MPDWAPSLTKSIYQHLKSTLINTFYLICLIHTRTKICHFRGGHLPTLSLIWPVPRQRVEKSSYWLWPRNSNILVYVINISDSICLSESFSGASRRILLPFNWATLIVYPCFSRLCAILSLPSPDCSSAFERQTPRAIAVVSFKPLP